MPAVKEFQFSGSTAVTMLVRQELVPVIESRDDSTVSSLSDVEGHGAASGSEGGSSTGPAERVVQALRLYLAHVGDCRAVLSHGGVAVDQYA